MENNAGRPQRGDDYEEASSSPSASDAAPLLASSASPPPPPRASLGLEAPRDASEEEEEDLATARLCLYASHLLSAWGARAWEFAAGLALFFSASGKSENDNASLSLVAALGLAQQAAQALSGPFLGKEVDRLPRLVAAERAYGLQAAGTLASAVLVLEARRRAKKAASLSSSTSSSSSPAFLVYLLGSLAAFFAALAAVGASGATLSVEREWTQALAKEGGGARKKERLRSRSLSNNGENEENDETNSSSSSALLASINATMRRIDLACLLASPGVAGLLLSKAGTEAAVVVIAVYGCCAWVPQAWLLRRAVRAAPSRLQEQEEKGEEEGGEGGRRRGRRATAEVEEEEEEQQQEATPSSSPSSSPLSPLSAYLSAEAFPSALALALLYLTVLSFGPLATAYLNWRGLDEVELALWRGVGAAAGIGATAAFPRLRSRFGADAAGALGIGSQFLCLSVGCLVAFFLPPSFGKKETGGEKEGKEGKGNGNTGARFLAASLASSRFGLWLFDLFASQNLQERVPLSQLGAVNGVQSALQAGLGAASFAAGLLVHRPKDFWVLATGSLGAVAVALVVSVCGAAKLREKERRGGRERAARREIAAVA